jgi:AraC-like DNA-binding protein
MEKEVTVISNLENLYHSVYETGLYLDEGFNIDELARMLNVQTYVLSTILRVDFGISFSDFKNNLRFKYAIIKISEGYLDMHTIDSLAKICGFKSRAHFSNAFKQKIGLPIKEISKYRNRYLVDSKNFLSLNTY